MLEDAKVWLDVGGLEGGDGVHRVVDVPDEGVEEAVVNGGQVFHLFAASAIGQ
jgi:hypothetical protein